MDIATLLQRPMPPQELVGADALTAPDTFAPAPELTQWITEAYLNENGALYTEQHAHLAGADIGCLWTTAENKSKGRRLVGQAELPGKSGGGNRWQKARTAQQIREWFGHPVNFLLTFDAFYSALECDDAMFCALVDHELCHCAQAEDEFGMPRFDKETGDPVFAIKGHDVEEFVSVVRRFGIEAAGPAATDLVIAAAQTPTISPVKLAQACGTCQRRNAA